MSETSKVTGGYFNKYHEEIIALCNYYEGCYDMALKFRDFINQKTVKVDAE